VAPQGSILYRHVVRSFRTKNWQIFKRFFATVLQQELAYAILGKYKKKFEINTHLNRALRDVKLK
jgi:hypothetical protein